MLVLLLGCCLGADEALVGSKLLARTQRQAEGCEVLVGEGGQLRSSDALRGENVDVLVQLEHLRCDVAVNAGRAVN
jgi:hypothetical protein